MKDKQEINRQLAQIRLEATKRYLELRGIDLWKLRELENQIHVKRDELINKFRENNKDAGRLQAEQHKISFDRVQMLIQRDLEKMMYTPPAWYPARHTDLKPAVCREGYPFKASSVSHDDEVNEIDAYTETEEGIRWRPSPLIGSVTYEQTGNVAHPLLDVVGYTGYVRDVYLKTWFKFKFTPRFDGGYFIRPLIYVNSWYYVASDRDRDPDTSNMALVVIKLLMKVSIRWHGLIPVKSISRRILDEKSTENTQPVLKYFSYDSEVDGGIGVSLQLIGGQEVEVDVICECETGTIGPGRAIIDMNMNPNLYFRVPEVLWGTFVCRPMDEPYGLPSGPYYLESP